NTTAIYSNYSSDIALIRDYNTYFRTTIRDLNLKQDFTLYNNSRHILKFGFNFIHHNILPGRINFSEAFGIDQPDEVMDRKAIEGAVYVSREQRVTSQLKLYYGVRWSWFSNIGPGNFFEFNESGELKNTIWIDNSSIFKTQGGLE